MMSSWQDHCKSSLSSFDECCAKRPPTLRSSQLTWTVSPPVGCHHLHPTSPFIIITQPEVWRLFYRPTEGRRLSNVYGVIALQLYFEGLVQLNQSCSKSSFDCFILKLWFHIYVLTRADFAHVNNIISRQQLASKGCLALWRQLLPYGYSYTIEHLVPDWVKQSFIVFDIRALWRSGLSVRVPGCQKLQMTA